MEELTQKEKLNLISETEIQLWNAFNIMGSSDKTLTNLEMIMVEVRNLNELHILEAFVNRIQPVRERGDNG